MPLNPAKILVGNAVTPLIPEGHHPISLQRFGSGSGIHTSKTDHGPIAIGVTEQGDEYRTA